MVVAHADLFGAPLLPGLAVTPDFVTAEEETMLIEAIDSTGLAPFRFQGWEGKRLTRSFGWRYDFDNGQFSEAEPIPDWLLPLRDRAERFAGLPPGALVQALVIRYDPGAGIGWHKDRPVFQHVVGISLGSEAPMRFRRRVDAKFERHNVALPPRSAYHLSGDARHDWEHSLAEVSRPRRSVTFRSLAAPRPLRA